jgi:uncharacterized OsmC-like protein
MSQLKQELTNMLPNGAGAPTIVTHAGGERFAIRIRSHEIMVDQTLKGGGEDSAPTPIELLGAALGSCIAYYVNQFLVTRNLSTEGLRVDVVQTKGSNPSRVEDFSIRLVLPPDLGEEYRIMLWRVIHACPAHNTLSMGATVNVTMESAREVLVEV